MGGGVGGRGHYVGDSQQWQSTIKGGKEEEEEKNSNGILVESTGHFNLYDNSRASACVCVRACVRACVRNYWMIWVRKE